MKEFTISGGNDEGVPPVPIPNTEVKPFSADGTWLVTARESRSPPDSKKLCSENYRVFSLSGYIGVWAVTMISLALIMPYAVPLLT